MAERKKLKAWQKVLIIIGSILLTIILIAGGYVSYILLSYNRIGDTDLTINQNSSLKEISTNTTYSALTYNIGFGAYSQDYTFFLDTGYDENGNETCGYYSKARSKEEVEFNVNGAIQTVEELNPDFIMFQEVDTNSTRSYHIDENEMITSSFESYDNYHCVNYHSAFLPYPLYDMHGSVNAGLTTLSKYQVNDAQRKEYTVSTSFSKFFDLDRCFSYSTVKVNNGKNLYIVNSHMSAYDTGGTIREKQRQELNDFLSMCKENGDYVIVGGDYNHDLLTYNPEYDYNDENIPFYVNKKTPDWVSFFFNEDGSSPLIDGYKVVASDNVPTCRNNDMDWVKGTTYTCVVDGFIVSDNIDISRHKNIETNNGNKNEDWFAYSDHQPAYIEFTLM